MFFGRRKHAASVPAAPAPVTATPQLSNELIFGAVQQTLAEVFGDNGEWTVARRDPAQSDTIFHEVLVHSIATSVTARVAAVRESLTVEAGPLGLLRAPRPPAPVNENEQTDAAGDELAGLSWEPAPITRWADLKRPVTGPTAIVDRPVLGSEGNKAA